MTSFRHFGVLGKVLLFASVVLSATVSMAQPNGLACPPSGPTNGGRVRLVVAFSPGGTVDAAARTMEHVIVDNRGGGGGLVGALDVVRAAPTGGTLLLTITTSLSVTTQTLKTPPFDPKTDLVAVSAVADVPMFLVAHPTFAARVGGNLAAALRSPNLNLGHPGNGSVAHLIGTQMARQSQGAITLIPYRGEAPLLDDVVAGRVQLAIASMRGIRTLLDAGRIQALAVLAPSRSAQFPGVSTALEAGLPPYDAGVSIALFAPKGTPQHVITCLQQSTEQYVRKPDVRTKLLQEGMELRGQTGEALSAALARDLQRWDAVIRAEGLKTD